LYRTYISYLQSLKISNNIPSNHFLSRSAQLYGEALRHVLHTILGNIELGVKSVCVTLHQEIFSDDIKEIFVLQVNIVF
jgi:hypothetical protein